MKMKKMYGGENNSGQEYRIVFALPKLASFRFSIRTIPGRAELWPWIMAQEKKGPSRRGSGWKEKW